MSIQISLPVKTTPVKINDLPSHVVDQHVGTVEKFTGR